MNLVAAFLFCGLVGCEGLHLSPAPIRALKGPSDQSCPNQTHWGIWIDGRDAHHGESFYGKKYGEPIERNLRWIYDKAKLQVEPNVDLFKEIATMLHEKFKETGPTHGVSRNIQVCLERNFDHAQLHDIMEDVMVCKENYEHAHKNKRDQISELFKEYNHRIILSKGSEDQLRAIAFLAHNLAFAHPLIDHNGRSRMLLIQHELRRLNLGCGTFLYNNNRDLVFSTLGQTLKKLKEGMSMYDAWRKTGVNPWIDPAVQKTHETNFAVSQELKNCWHERMKKTPCMHKGCNHKGTDVTLLEK